VSSTAAASADVETIFEIQISVSLSYSTTKNRYCKSSTIDRGEPVTVGTVRGGKTWGTQKQRVKTGRGKTGEKTGVLSEQGEILQNGGAL